MQHHELILKAKHLMKENEMIGKEDIIPGIVKEAPKSNNLLLKTGNSFQINFRGLALLDEVILEPVQSVFIEQIKVKMPTNYKMSLLRAVRTVIHSEEGNYDHLYNRNLTRCRSNHTSQFTRFSIQSWSSQWSHICIICGRYAPRFEH
jgi:hypothetical protein